MAPPAASRSTNVALRDDVARMQPYFDLTDDQLAFFEPLFGPYPLDAYGLAFADSVPGAGDGDAGPLAVLPRTTSRARSTRPRRCSSPTSWPTSGSATR